MSAPDHLRFHHIGYAVANIAAAKRELLDPLFAPEWLGEPIADPIQRVRVCFGRLPGGPLIELVEPLGPDSPVSHIIERRRGGLYHTCFETSALDVAIAAFRKRRCLPVTRPAPAAAFGGRRIVFVLSPAGDLFELLEAPSPPGLVAPPSIP
ncbi:MAG: VOC family protein [Sphingomonadaceae bacterium]|nr:VOC family protein [Sphingomonadaceae bacterium]